VSRVAPFGPPYSLFARGSIVDPSNISWTSLRARAFRRALVSAHSMPIARRIRGETSLSTYTIYTIYRACATSRQPVYSPDEAVERARVLGHSGVVTKIVRAASAHDEARSEGRPAPAAAEILERRDQYVGR
jgi:hypothetical protein